MVNVGDGSKYRVLVIEDEPDLLELFAESLARAGYEVQECSNYSGAKDLLFSGKFHALVTDWQVNDKKMDLVLMNPGMTHLLPKVVIVLSAYSDSEFFPKILFHNFKVFEKPFNMDVLLSCLENELKATPQNST